MLLQAAFLCFLQWLYRLSVEEVPDGDYMLPLSQAEVRISLSYMLFWS